MNEKYEENRLEIHLGNESFICRRVCICVQDERRCKARIIKIYQDDWKKLTLIAKKESSRIDIFILSLSRTININFNANYKIKAMMK